MIKVNIYTSYYRKMAQREKKENDIYVQISRTIFCPMKDKGGIAVQKQIDIEMGDILGNYAETLKDYYDFLKDFNEESGKEIIQAFKEDIEEAEESGETKGFECLNFFLLCHENLEGKYTKKSKAVIDGFAKEGDWQICHRRVLADFIQNTYNYFIPEYDIQEENKEVVYRRYF